MAEITGEPVGYLVACENPDGSYDVDQMGLWATPEEAAAERGKAEFGKIGSTGYRYRSCAVVPLEEPG